MHQYSCIWTEEEKSRRKKKKDIHLLVLGNKSHILGRRCDGEGDVDILDRVNGAKSVSPRLLLR